MMRLMAVGTSMGRTFDESPKMGLCSTCKGKFELSSLMSCGSCRKKHYCSVACQAADWESHKGGCKIWKKWFADGVSASNQLSQA
mmetsp:Transcript_19364/g.33012  ORF Transcript_19364/g.33012 Transcript_19364/m.33012 type:complete len:85 (+) Transcript_19364:169-423(+)